MKLVFHFENGDLEEFSVNKSKVLVGRGSDCDVILTTPGFSRHHALMELVAGEFFVTDLNSTNGVFIDSNRIPPSQSVPLKTFFTLQMGPAIQVEFIDDSDEPVSDNFKSTLDEFVTSDGPTAKRKRPKEIVKTGPEVPKARNKKGESKKSPPERSGPNKMVLFGLPILIVVGAFFLMQDKEETSGEGAIQSNQVVEPKNEVINSDFIDAGSVMTLYSQKNCQGEIGQWCITGEVRESDGEGIVVQGKNLIIYLHLDSVMDIKYSDVFQGLSQLSRIEVLLLRRLFQTNLVRDFTRQSNLDSIQAIAMLKVSGEPKAKLMVKINRNFDYSRFDKFVMNAAFDQMINEGNQEEFNKLSRLYESRALE